MRKGLETNAAYCTGSKQAGEGKGVECGERHCGQEQVRRLEGMSTTIHIPVWLISGIHLEIFLDISVEYHSSYPSAKFYRDWRRIDA
jgi:hypothetical protein